LIAWGIIDTGPLVAYLSENEPDHAWSAAQFDLADEPFLTCEAVITEAYYLLRRDGKGHRRLFDLLNRDLVRVNFTLARERGVIGGMMDDYADLPRSLADACLVRMSELHPRAEIITLDRHFKLYRTRDRRVLRLRLPPRHGPIAATG
jgi:uncharacterized protein